MLRKNPQTVKHVSTMLERGHLVVMPFEVNLNNVKHELKRVTRFNDIDFVPDSEAVVLFERTIKLMDLRK